MGGEGILPSRPEAMPDAIERPGLCEPGALLKLGTDGVWRVLLLVPHPGSVFDGDTVARDLTVAEAEKLAWALLDHALLIREKQA